MIARILSIMLGTKNARELKKMHPIITHINDLEPAMEKLSDSELSAKTNEFRKRLTQGETLDDLLPEAFAVVREASKRCLGLRPYDVQLMGGMVLHQGKIAEMKTGEGKTLTATLPLYLNALSGKGVHLVTVNDYLARRDSEWNKPIYDFLDMTVGCLQNMMEDRERKKMYQCDVLYGTNSEFGFDYLRDNMKFRLEDYVQRDLNFAIVDEVDSILIDEARTPLIISGSSVEESKLYSGADRAVKRLVKDQDYEVDEKMRTVHLTESGIDKVEDSLGVKNIYAGDNVSVLHHVNQALKANAIFRRDVDYVVQDGQVLIVDEFTGRILAGRRYSDGLHQALEAKEGVEIERETQTLASITLQNYFRLYNKLAGMTGTAQTEAEEFYKIYKLDVVAIPTNVPMVRDDKADLIFLSENAKFNAIVSDIKERYAKGQPVLIGTVAVETSEKLSNALRQAGIAHEVLNAKQHEREADIIQHAGEPGHVTIATNMAGRGTDIKLKPESLEAGGLYILGTERHESRRIDNQLRGRSGRQGDVGESRFYIGLDDDLIRRFAGETLKKNMQRFGMKEDEIIESNFVSKTIERAQEKVEKQNFEMRKHLLEFDDVLNQQRIVVYGMRREILESDENSAGIVRDMINRSLQDLIFAYCPDRNITKEQVQNIFKEVSDITTLPLDDIKRARISTTNREVFTRDLQNYVVEKYALFTQEAQKDMLASAQKWLMLETLDTAWKQHMLNLDHLKEGINLRSYAQKNPLIEYKREAFAMFQDMMASLRRSIVHSIFHINIEHFNAHEIEKRRERELEEMRMRGHDQSGDSAQPMQRSADRIGRNDACPCGSGAKYKKCCGA